MCFEIVNTKPSRRVVGYKVVSAKRKPVYYPNSRITYKVGSTVKIPSRGVTVVNTIGDESMAGIYVFFTKKAAEDEIGYWNGCEGHGYQIIKLRLDPKDFIASGKDGDKHDVATYRKVVVLS